MNPYDDHYIVEIEIVAKVSVGFSVPSGTSHEAVEAQAGHIVVTMSPEELIDNIYDMDSVSFIGVEQD
jgi:H2-forming N5,N10-methylenetetrahydromethanopterin dehydrogenase-like enzyme